MCRFKLYIPYFVMISEISRESLSGTGVVYVRINNLACGFKNGTDARYGVITFRVQIYVGSSYTYYTPR